MVLAVYQLAYAVALVSGGRIGDAIGRRRTFLLGVGGFTLASALCGAAPSAEALIAARALQGLAAALLFPQVLSIVQVTFPPAERPRAFAAMGAVIGVATIAGQLVGGALIALDPAGLGWRAVFLVNLPLGLAAIVAARRLVPESRAPRGAAARRRRRRARDRHAAAAPDRAAGGPRGRLADMGVGRAGLRPPLGAAFVAWERRVAAAGEAPLFALSLLGIVSLRRGLGLVLVFYPGLNAFFLMLAFYLQDGMGLTALQSGLVYTPLALGFFVVSLLAPRLVRRLGPAALALGAAVAAGGYVAVVVLVSAAGATLPTVPLIVALVAIGCGQALFLTPLFATVLQGVPTSAAGAASGALSTVQQVGGAVGVAAIGALFFGLLGATPDRADYAHAFATAAVANVAIALAAALLALRLPRAEAEVGSDGADAAAGAEVAAPARSLRPGYRFSVTFALTPAPATVSVTFFARRRLLRANLLKRRVTVAPPPFPAFALPLARRVLPRRAISATLVPALTPPTRTTSPRASTRLSFALLTLTVACAVPLGAGLCVPPPLPLSSPLGTPPPRSTVSQLALTTSSASAITLSVPTPQSIESISPSRALTTSLPYGYLHQSGPQSPPLRSAKTMSRPGPGSIVSSPKLASTSSLPGPPPTTSLPSPPWTTSSPPPASIRTDLVDLVELERLGGVGADDVAVDPEDDPLDAADVVVLARAAVVGAAAERQLDVRLDVVVGAVAPVDVDRVGAGAAVDHVAPLALGAVAGDVVVAGAALDAVAADLALDRVVAVAAEQRVVAVVAVQSVVAGSAVERAGGLLGLDVVVAGAAEDRDRHSDAKRDVLLVVAVAEIDADRRRLDRAGDGGDAARRGGRLVGAVGGTGGERARGVVEDDADARRRSTGRRCGFSPGRGRVDERAVGGAGDGGGAARRRVRARRRRSVRAWSEAAGGGSCDRSIRSNGGVPSGDPRTAPRTWVAAGGGKRRRAGRRQASSAAASGRPASGQQRRCRRAAGVLGPGGGVAS